MQPGGTGDHGCMRIGEDHGLPACLHSLPFGPTSALCSPPCMPRCWSPNGALRHPALHGLRSMFSISMSRNHERSSGSPVVLVVRAKRELTSTHMQVPQRQGDRRALFTAASCWQPALVFISETGAALSAHKAEGELCSVERAPPCPAALWCKLRRPPSAMCTLTAAWASTSASVYPCRARSLSQRRLP